MERTSVNKGTTHVIVAKVQLPDWGRLVVVSAELASERLLRHRVAVQLVVAEVELPQPRQQGERAVDDAADVVVLIGEDSDVLCRHLGHFGQRVLVIDEMDVGLVGGPRVAGRVGAVEVLVGAVDDERWALSARTSGAEGRPPRLGWPRDQDQDQRQAEEAPQGGRRPQLHGSVCRIKTNKQAELYIYRAST